MNIIEYENYHEHLSVPDPNFPYLTYLCSIPQDFSLVPVHWHQEMELIYIKKGAGIVEVNLHPYDVSAGDLVLVCPGSLHSIRRKEDYAMEYENIIFPLSLLEGSQPDPVWNTWIAPIHRRRAVLPVLLSPFMPSYAALSSCINAIDQIRRSLPPAWELFIRGKLCEFFFLLYQFALVTASAPSRSQTRSLEKARQILKYLEDHYKEPISIKKMAEASGFSQSHFMKFFKATFHVSFTEYLNRYRLTMAERILLSSDVSVLTAAQESGFENLSYFNRLFKKQYGVTPRELRRQNQGSPSMGPPV